MAIAERIPLRSLRHARAGDRIIWLRGLAFELSARRYKMRNPQKRITTFWWFPVVDGVELTKYQCWSRKAALQTASLYTRLRHIPQWTRCADCLTGEIAPVFAWGWRDTVRLQCTTCHHTHRWQPVEDISATWQNMYESITVTRHPDGTTSEERTRKPRV